MILTLLSLKIDYFPLLKDQYLEEDFFLILFYLFIYFSYLTSVQTRAKYECWDVRGSRCLNTSI